MRSKPKLSDVEFEQKYEAGDRMLVRSSVRLNKDQATRVVVDLRKATRADVRVLVLSISDVRATIDRADGTCVVIIGSEHLQLVKNGKLDVGVAKVELNRGDKVTVVVKVVPERIQKDLFESMIRKWVGPNNEVLILWGMDF